VPSVLTCLNFSFTSEYLLDLVLFRFMVIMLRVIKLLEYNNNKKKEEEKNYNLFLIA
jgi:hypothetical protein